MSIYKRIIYKRALNFEVIGLTNYQIDTGKDMSYNENSLFRTAQLCLL